MTKRNCLLTKINSNVSSLRLSMDVCRIHGVQRCCTFKLHCRKVTARVKNFFREVACLRFQAKWVVSGRSFRKISEYMPWSLYAMHISRCGKLP